MLFILIVLVAAGVIPGIVRMEPAPDVSQRIVATLVGWGMSVDGLHAAVDPAEVDRQIALLSSPMGEERVRAARWLAARGVRDAGDAIVAAMYDRGTSRPCQLAHALGQLGDDRWADDLILATRHPNNSDLRVCATIGLRELATPKAIAGLIDVYERDAASSAALQALGDIADPAALAFLEAVAERPRNRFERTAALEAIGKVHAMAQPDPVATLLERLTSGFDESGRADHWALRKLAELSDPRTVTTLERILRSDVCQSDGDRIAVVAALLAHGPAGRSAIDRLAGASADAPNASTAVAAAAQRLIAHTPATRSGGGG